MIVISEQALTEVATSDGDSVRQGNQHNAHNLIREDQNRMKDARVCFGLCRVNDNTDTRVLKCTSVEQAFDSERDEKRSHDQTLHYLCVMRSPFSQNCVEGKLITWSEFWTTRKRTHRPTPQWKRTSQRPGKRA